MVAVRGVSFAFWHLPTGYLCIHLLKILRPGPVQKLSDAGIEEEGSGEPQAGLRGVMGEIKTPAIVIGPVIQCADETLATKLQVQTNLALGAGKVLFHAVDADVAHGSRFRG